jgi:hypothetical protein
MILRLLADADLNRAICRRRDSPKPGIGLQACCRFKGIEDVPLEGLDDLTVLDLAARDQRVLISHDVSTMPDHFRQYTRRNISSGLILVPQELSIGKAIENILVICEACNQDDIENKICLVPGLVMYGF